MPARPKGAPAVIALVLAALFFVDAKGTIVRHFVNFQEMRALEAAAKLALQ
jgi:hypothetical protein